MNRKLVIVVLIALLLACTVPADITRANPGWNYYKDVAFSASDTTGIKGTHSNFPVLISTTDDDLRHTGSGGGMGKTDATDLRFTDTGNNNSYDYEIEKYTPGTGELVVWVRVPTLADAGTTIRMWYGNAAADDGQNATGVWDSNYQMVHHLKDEITAASTATVATTTSTEGIYTGAKRYTHYANGYYWAVFYDGTNPVIYSSSDGSSWTSRGNIPYTSGLVENSNQYGVRFKSTTMVVGMVDASANQAYYRKASLDSDGTVTWWPTSSDQSQGTQGQDDGYWAAISSDDKPWAGNEYPDAGYIDARKGTALESPSWSEYTFPNFLQATSYVPSMMLFPVDDAGDMYAIGTNVHTGIDGDIEGIKWDDSGTSWDGAWTQIANGALQKSTQEGRISATKNTDGEIHIVAIDDGGRLDHYKRSTGGSWSSATTDITSLTSHTKIALSAVGNNLYVFYDKGDNKIYYREYDSWEWGSEATLKSDATALQGAISAYESSQNNEVGVIWVEGSGSPYNVKFAKLDVAPVNDSTSNNNYGTKKDVDEPAEATGKIGQGQNFDGNNDRIDITGGSWVPNTTMTVSAWIKPTNCSAERWAVSQYEQSTTKRNFALNHPSNNFVHWNTANNLLSSDGRPTVGNWWYVVGTADLGADTMELFIDGTSDKSQANTNSPASDLTARIMIGSVYMEPGDWRPFLGLIDEVRISNIVRSDDWVKTEYNNQSDPSTFHTIDASPTDVSGGADPVPELPTIILMSVGLVGLGIYLWLRRKRLIYAHL